MVSIASNQLAEEANQLSHKAISLEYEPNFRIVTSKETRQWKGTLVTVFVAKAINMGRLPVELESPMFVFPRSKFGFGFTRILGLNMDDPELPQLVEPGHSFSATTLISELRSSLIIQEGKGETEFEIIFGDATGERHSSGLIQINPFIQDLDMFVSLVEIISQIGEPELPN